MHTLRSLLSFGWEPSEAMQNTGSTEYPRTDSSKFDLSNVVTCVQRQADGVRSKTTL